MKADAKLCKKCQSEISKKAKICPHCRGKQKKPIGLIVLGVFVLFIIIGSMGDSSENKVSRGSSNPNSPNEESEELIFGVHETAEFPDLKITALRAQSSKGGDFITPSDGNVFVGVRFEVENISDKTHIISSILLFDPYVDGVKSELSFSALTHFSDGTLDGELAPGRKMVGWYAVETNARAKSIELFVKDTWLSKNKAQFVLDIK